MKSFRERLPSPAMVVAIISLVVATGGVSYAAIKANSIKSKHIANGQVKSADLADNGVKGADIDESSLQGLVAAGDFLWARVAGPAGGEGPGEVLGASHPDVTSVDPPGYGGVIVRFPRDVTDCTVVPHGGYEGGVSGTPTHAFASPEEGNPNGLLVTTDYADGTLTEADEVTLLVLC